MTGCWPKFSNKNFKTEYAQRYYVCVGGINEEDAADNYHRVVEKLHRANLKVTSEKTKILPKQADVLGLVWKEGGRLTASPHRKPALHSENILSKILALQIKRLLFLFLAFQNLKYDVCLFSFPLL